MQRQESRRNASFLCWACRALGVLVVLALAVHGVWLPAGREGRSERMSSSVVQDWRDLARTPESEGRTVLLLQQTRAALPALVAELQEGRATASELRLAMQFVQSLDRDCVRALVALYQLDEAEAILDRPSGLGEMRPEDADLLVPLVVDPASSRYARKWAWHYLYEARCADSRLVPAARERASDADVALLDRVEAAELLLHTEAAADGARLLCQLAELAASPDAPAFSGRESTKTRARWLERAFAELAGSSEAALVILDTLVGWIDGDAMIGEQSLGELACRAIVALGPSASRAVPALEARLEATGSWSCLRALASLGDEGVEVVCRNLDRDPELAARALAGAGTSVAALEALHELLRTGSARVRQAACQALSPDAMHAHPDLAARVRAELDAILVGEDDRLRQDAVEALHRCGWASAKSVDALFEFARQASPRGLRRRWLQRLRSTPDLPAGAWRALLQPPDEEELPVTYERVGAILDLAGDERAAAVLALLGSDVQSAGVTLDLLAPEGLCTPEVVRRLVQLCEHRSDWLRLSAARALLRVEPATELARQVEAELSLRAVVQRATGAQVALGADGSALLMAISRFPVHDDVRLYLSELLTAEKWGWSIHTVDLANAAHAFDYGVTHVPLYRYLEAGWLYFASDGAGATFALDVVGGRVLFQYSGEVPEPGATTDDVAALAVVLWPGLREFLLYQHDAERGLVEWGL